MSSETTIDELKRKHATLDAQLDEEIQRPLPDQAIVSHLKREKLKIKDTIATLERN